MVPTPVQPSGDSRETRNRTRRPAVRRASPAVILLLAILAGLADYIEDYFIYQGLHLAPPQQLVPSLIKWTALSLALATVGVAMLRNVTAIYSARVPKILGVAHLIAAALLLAGAASVKR